MIVCREHLSDYVLFLEELVKHARKGLRIVVDASNGPVGGICDEVLGKLGIEYIPMNFTPNGNFPGHDPNPLKGNSQDPARQKLLEEKADFACLFDADADRVVFIDEMGKTIPPDHLAAVIAEDAVRRKHGGSVVVDCISSRAVGEAVKRAGGEIIISRVGRAFILKEAKSHTTVFSAEASSHYFHPEAYHIDSGVVTLLRVIEIVTQKNMPLSQIVKPHAHYAQSGEVNVTVKDKDVSIAAITEEFSDGEQSTLDGISVSYPTVWFNVRPSNTEPLLRLRVEGMSDKIVASTLEKIKEIVQR